MQKVVYSLSVEEILAIHYELIQFSGGSFGLLSVEMLFSAVGRPTQMFNGAYVYQNLEEMAAALFQSLIMNHPFVDGNKRTAYIVMLRFLNLNGLVIRFHKKEVIELVQQCVTKHLSVKDIAQWIARHIVSNLTDV